jgi:hypothetical protein
MDTDILLYVGLGAAVVLVAAVVILLFVRGRGGKEWGQLAERFPARKEPTGKTLTRHTVKVGTDVCRQCVTVVVADPGLYLRVDHFLRRRPGVLIPWDEFRDVAEGKLQFQKAAVLTVGERATLTMPMRLYDRVRSHMPGPLRRRV